MKSFLPLIILFVSTNITAQSKIEKLKNEVLKEGILLYESESASWYGSDLFFEKFTDRSKIGGYVSYTDGENPKCIFLSKGENPKVIGTMTFEKTFNLKSATTDLTERDPTQLEKEYFALRVNALKRITSDTIFKHYKNTNYNIVPLISNNEKKVYVITGSTVNGVVYFGNDYLINFDKKNNVSKTSRLHRGLISVEYGDKEKQIVAPMHSHIPEYSDIITPTDICTTMLYQKFAGWEKNYVMSRKYISIWDCNKNDLTIMTMEAWEKIVNEKKE